jgi:hypothetical protein
MSTFQCEECDCRFYCGDGGIPTTCDDCWEDLTGKPTGIKTHGPEVQAAVTELTEMGGE